MKQKIYKNQTFSLPVEVSLELHSLVKRREMSRFVADAIRKELAVKKHELRKAYLSANQDPGQVEATEEWQGTLADGADECGKAHPISPRIIIKSIPHGSSILQPGVSLHDFS